MFMKFIMKLNQWACFSTPIPTINVCTVSTCLGCYLWNSTNISGWFIFIAVENLEIISMLFRQNVWCYLYIICWQYTLFFYSFIYISGAWHWIVYTVEWRWWISYQFALLGYCNPWEFLPWKKVSFLVKTHFFPWEGKKYLSSGKKPNPG